MLDLEPYVLRYWETEFEQLAPEKSRSGQRIYRRAGDARVSDHYVLELWVTFRGGALRILTK